VKPTIRVATVRFRTTLYQADGKNATGILVPAAVISQLGHGKRPPVRVSINGYEYRTTVGVMGGQAMSLQRFHVDTINGAKTDETRQRRIEKAVAFFRTGKKR
jgi:hypothetical protein